MKMLKCLAISAIICLSGILPNSVFAQSEDPVGHITPLIGGGIIGVENCTGLNLSTTTLNFIVGSTGNNVPECTVDLYLAVYDHTNYAPFKNIIGIQHIPYSSFACPEGGNGSNKSSNSLVGDCFGMCETNVSVVVNIPNHMCDGVETTVIDLAYRLVTQDAFGFYVPFQNVASVACMDALFRPGCFYGYNTPRSSQNPEDRYYEHDENDNVPLECCDNTRSLDEENVTIFTPALRVQNPFSGTLNFSLDVAEGDLQLTLVNLEGRVVWQKQENVDQGIRDYNVSTDKLPNGLYFLRIMQGENMETIKLMKL
ncbi:MAG: T9SS type A sorting domain-containing protein [Bacteroidota bacterium]